MSGLQLLAREVGGAIADITRELEQRSAITNAIITGNGFEKWWQTELLNGFTRDPWLRKSGRSIESGAGVAIESTWDVPDARRAFVKRTGKTRKQIDLIVRRGGVGGKMSHLVELKLLSGRTGTARTVASIKEDLLALYAIRDLQDVSSCWMGILAHSFSSREEIIEELSGVEDSTLSMHPPRAHSIAKSGDSKIWVVGIQLKT